MISKSMTVPLLEAVNDCYLTGDPNCKLASVWFYNFFYVFTAGPIVLLAQIHPPILEFMEHEVLEKTWTRCQATLKYLECYSTVAERCAHGLNAMRSIYPTHPLMGEMSLLSLPNMTKRAF
ncbi:hypothetical protein BO70DRAFT_397855 [Aspergillus heteromorphus CBS 117.55]|uniref:Uncharacterized protein n=1 Tax=Aspergillus heteromorphus CBS 117.55 TaxID=1448321 RepID=A0A317VRM2_9EURO|nr:uncharacterized protein BO70DRAFT_397855 [Aspergillus heteromorphus CBS 117.55]PWY76963.1 hypothetical protein BO70DRAFT_397855 [Aspergillus heteromorphus CBS 117.55]